MASARRPALFPYTTLFRSVIGANGVRLRYSVGDDNAANGGGAHQKSVRVKFNGRVVLIGKKGELRRVTLGHEVLDVNISDLHLLVTGSESVEMTICVLLQHEEISEVVVDAIRKQIAEDSHSWFFIGKYKAAKVAGELLNSSRSEEHTSELQSLRHL